MPCQCRIERDTCCHRSPHRSRFDSSLNRCRSGIGSRRACRLRCRNRRRQCISGLGCIEQDKRCHRSPRRSRFHSSPNRCRTPVGKHWRRRRHCRNRPERGNFCQGYSANNGRHSRRRFPCRSLRRPGTSQPDTRARDRHENNSARPSRSSHRYLDTAAG